MDNTYWNKTGKYQELADQLREFIPAMGSVEHPRKNPALEKFRKASNCYYDLYNNGLGNRNAEFRQIFGLAPSHYKHSFIRFKFSDDLYEEVEVKMNRIVLDAAIERGLVKQDEDGVLI